MTKIVLALKKAEDSAHVADKLGRDLDKHLIVNLPPGVDLSSFIPKTEFCALVIDLSLLLKSGKELLRSVKQKRSSPPVIALVDPGRESEALELIKEGLDDYVLNSPSGLSHLPVSIRISLERSRHTRAAIKEIEETHQLIFERSPIGIFRTTPEGRILDANPAFVEMMGYPDKETFLATNIINFYVNPEERERWKEALEKEGFVKGYQLEWKRLDGSPVWIESYGYVQRGEKGEVLYYGGIIQDITWKKLAEEALKESEERYRTLIEASNDGICIIQEESFAFVNKKFLEIFGFSSDKEILGEPFFKIIHPDDIERILRIKRLRNKGGPAPSRYEFKARRVDGRLLYIEVSAAYLNFKARPASMLFLRDITERRRGEEERMLLATAIYQSSESIVITDSKGNIQYVNPAFEEITGYSRSEVLGENPRVLKSGQHGEAFYKELWDTITSGKTWRGSFVNKRKDGTLYEEEATISPVTDIKGNITNFVAVKRDVSGQRRLERMLRQAQKMEAIGTLAGGIAHDFNNILSAIVGYAELAYMDLAPDSALAGNIEQILAAAGRARDLVRQILAFSRQSEEEKRPIHVQPIVKEVIRMLRSSLPAYMEVRGQVDSKAGPIMGDPIQVHQILMNLCTNAAQAMREEGGVIEIKLEEIEIGHDYTGIQPEARAGKYLKLVVRDTGCGMSPEIMEKIFDPYFTTKSKGEGTGLGLSVAMGIVKEYGGFIEVESAPSQGSTFKVYLPITPEQGSQTQERPQQEDITGRGEHVLLVDDEEVLVEIASQMLHALGYQVTQRTSPIEALELFKSRSGDFDIVVTDMTMPQMTGDKLAINLLQIRPDIPIVLCTGFSERIGEAEARQLGIREFLMKPFVLKDLGHAVKRALTRPDGPA